jgi:hypothetical protein
MGRLILSDLKQIGVLCIAGETMSVDFVSTARLKDLSA